MLEILYISKNKAELTLKTMSLKPVTPGSSFTQLQIWIIASEYGINSQIWKKLSALSYCSFTQTCLQMKTLSCQSFNIWVFSTGSQANNLLRIILNNTYCDWTNLASNQQLIKEKLIMYLSWNALYLWQNVLTLSQSSYLKLN